MLLFSAIVGCAERKSNNAKESRPAHSGIKMSKSNRLREALIAFKEAVADDYDEEELFDRILLRNPKLTRATFNDWFGKGRIPTEHYFNALTRVAIDLKHLSEDRKSPGRRKWRRLYREAQKAKARRSATLGREPAAHLLTQLALFESQLRGPMDPVQRRILIASCDGVASRLLSAIQSLDHSDHLVGAAMPLLRIRHWNDRRGIERVAAYDDVLYLLTTKLGDYRNLDVLRFLLTFLTRRQVSRPEVDLWNGYPEDEIRHQALTNKIGTLAADFTDLLLTPDLSNSASLCQTIEGGKKERTLGSAGIWRCVACKAMKARNALGSSERSQAGSLDSIIRQAIDKSRSHLAQVSQLPAAAEIAMFLDVIEVLSQWETSPTYDEKLLARVMVVREAHAPRLAVAKSLLMPLDYVEMSLLRAHESRATRQKDDSRFRLHALANSVEIAAATSIRSLCCYDLESVKASASVVAIKYG